MATANKYHPVPNAKMIHAWYHEHPAWSVLLQMLVLDGETVVLQCLQLVRLYISVDNEREEQALYGGSKNASILKSRQDVWRPQATTHVGVLVRSFVTNIVS